MNTKLHAVTDANGRPLSFYGPENRTYKERKEGVPGWDMRTASPALTISGKPSPARDSPVTRSN